MAEDARGRPPTGREPARDDVAELDPTRVEVAATPVAPLASSTLAGRYRLERIIGSGGMAQVWEATDLVLDRKVAVKVLHPHLALDQALVARFRQEAIAAARLSHPGIVSVYDTCTDGYHEAIVMELLDGTTLRQHLADHGPLDAPTTMRVAMRLLDALEAAHRAGLVHRDIKPSNILLSSDGRVRITDFGIAKAEDQTELTQEGTLVGTAAYLAPEQLQDQPIDGRADLYSLGIVLYECVTGRVPFTGESRAALALARLHSDPVDPRRIRSDVPAPFAAVLMRTLERDPADRYASAADLRAALLELDSSVSPVVDAVPPLPEAYDFDEEPTEQHPTFARSERRWLLPAMFIVMIAVAVTVAGLLLRDSGITTFGRSTEGEQATDGPDPVAHQFDGAIAFDPQGGDGENDRRAPDAIDGDVTTAWRTESYDAASFFGSKTGVGLALTLPQPIEITELSIDGSANGWNASIFVIDSAQLGAQSPADALETIDPTTLTAVVDITDVTGPQKISFDGAGASGDLVLIWITDLGGRGDNARHRVEINEVRVLGHAVGA